MNLNELAREVHQNAVEHGWWNPEPSFPEIIALCHSELSEALQAYRNGEPLVWHACLTAPSQHACAPVDPFYYGMYGDEELCAYINKEPRGIAVELGDCILRIMDYFVGRGVDTERQVERALKLGDTGHPFSDEAFGAMVASLHAGLSSALLAAQSPIPLDSVDPEDWMALCIVGIMDWAENKGLDMEAILREKLEYNKGRPYRHGGKRL